MRRSFGLLLITLLLAACALPWSQQPAPATLLPTTAADLPASTPEQPLAPTAVQPVGAANPTATAGELDDPARIAGSPPGPRDQVALAEAFKRIADVPAVARTSPLEVKLGDVESFWVADFAANTNYQVSAKLRYIGPIVLMYVDTTIEVGQAELELSAKQFETQIYPRNRAVFGAERAPGVDGDPRLTILNTVLRGGAAGYFSGSDEVVKAVNRFSNEREMFVMGVNAYKLGSDAYASTLAHEFQHMIEANQQPRSPLWINEGMSTIAQDLNGYVEQGFPFDYLQNADLQLTAWQPLDSAHYGASQLFLRYFQQQYAGEQGLSELIKADVGNNFEAFVPIAARKRPEIKRFADIYADWAVANVLNDPQVENGRYAYDLLPQLAQTNDFQPEATTSVNQFGVDYYAGLKGPLTVHFDGADTVGLTGTQPQDGRYAWWSNRADNSVETLTRAFDLSGLANASLQFSTWYELELNFDYAFVSVSQDGGQTWQALRASTSTDVDPQGHNYGNGITGVSGAPNVETDKGVRGQWLDEEVDLAQFAGKKILLRFWVVNDDGYNAAGMLIDDIRIPELGYRDSGEAGDGGWQAQGFVRTTGELAQTWALRLVRTKAGVHSVEQLPLDPQGRATVQVAAGERAILAVIGTTPFTTEPANYSYSVTEP